MKNNELTEVKAAMPSLEGLPQEVIEYVHGLVAESAAINDRLQKLIQIGNNADNSYCMCGDSMKSHAGGGCGSPTGMFDYHYNAWLESEKETPATSAAIAEIKASELDDLARSIMEYAPVIESDEYHVYEVIAKDVTDRATNLRAGRKG